MSTEGTIQLISPSLRFRATLEPSQSILDPHAGLITTVKAKQVRFEGGRAQIPAAWLPLLEACDAFTGGPRSKKMIFMADGSDTPNVDAGGPLEARGAITASVRRASEAPVAGWDDMAAKAIVGLVTSGQVRDLVVALTWEAEHKRRATVMTAITKAIASGSGEDPDEVVDDLVVSEVFGAPVPEED
jgi:hypothetical protein